MKVTRTSMISRITRTKEIDVTEGQMENYYLKGMLIQDAFPHLSASDREFIMTGMTDDEWNKATSEDE